MLYGDWNFGVDRITSIVVVSVISAAWLGLRNRWRTRSSSDWPTTTATILSGDVQTSEENLNALATLTYSYFVGEYRAGQFKRYLESEAAAADFVRMTKGRKVEVRYDPKHPHRSVLVEESLAAAEQAGMIEEAAG